MTEVTAVTNMEPRSANVFSCTLFVQRRSQECVLECALVRAEGPKFEAEGRERGRVS